MALNEKFSVYDAYKIHPSIDFGDDEASVYCYYMKTLKKSGLKDLFKNIENNDNAILWNMPCTTIMVEQSFSVLNDITRPTRHFLNENLIMYIKARINK